jgi:hypothetical protein
LQLQGQEQEQGHYRAGVCALWGELLQWLCSLICETLSLLSLLLLLLTSLAKASFEQWQWMQQQQ